MLSLTSQVIADLILGCEYRLSETDRCILQERRELDLVFLDLMIACNTELQSDTTYIDAKVRYNSCLNPLYVYKRLLNQSGVECTRGKFSTSQYPNQTEHSNNCFPSSLQLSLHKSNILCHSPRQQLDLAGTNFISPSFLPSVFLLA